MADGANKIVVEINSMVQNTHSAITALSPKCGTITIRKVIETFLTSSI